MMLMRGFCVLFSEFFFIKKKTQKNICCGYSFELHGTLHISRKKYTGCNLKITELLECALVGVCAVIRSNTVNMEIPRTVHDNRTEPHKSTEIPPLDRQHSSKSER